MDYKYDVFISYSRKDSKTADIVCSYFEQNKISYFLDREEMVGGENYLDRLAESILSSRLFLFLASENSYNSKHTIEEIAFAHNYKDKSCLIPYIIDNSVLPQKGIGLIFASSHQLNISNHPIESSLINVIRQKIKDFSKGHITFTTKNNELQKSEEKVGGQQESPQQVPRDLKLSYFTGEQHSENYKQIILLAGELGYSVRVCESKGASQFDFLQAVYRDTATIVDATIPENLTLSTVYPLLTAHANILDHILIFSDKQYEDGSQILPLNITPQRVRTDKDKDLLSWLRTQLEDLKEHQYYDRFEIESIEKLADYKYPMEKVMSASLELHKPKKGDKKQVMISYRNSCSKDVEAFHKREEGKDEVNIIVLPPGSLCDDFEAHSPMRRWMLVGLLEDHIRSVNEVWVYYNDIYTNSWWTLAEMVMVAYINHNRKEEDKVRVKVYDAVKTRFVEKDEEGYPSFLHISLSDKQHQKLARFLSNTRPDTMGPETLRQIAGLKKMAWIMRFMTKKKRAFLAEQMRPMIEQGVPSDISEEDRNKMVNDLLTMYSDPKAIMAYANDDVFKDTFWNNISYQTDRVTAAFKNGSIDVDTFMDTPMQELTKFKDENLHEAADNNTQIKLKGKKYYVGEGKKRYLWLATRMGMPTVKDAPGLEVLQTYNLLTHDQIVGMVMKKLL